MRVTDEMVEVALAAYVRARGTYEREVPADGDDIRAALEAALSHAAGQEVAIRHGWLHWLRKYDPDVEDDYDIYDISQCPSRPCPDCIPVSIVHGHLPAVARSEGEATPSDKSTGRPPT